MRTVLGSIKRLRRALRLLFVSVMSLTGFLALGIPVPAVCQKPDVALDGTVWARERELLRKTENERGGQLFECYLRLAQLFKDHERELCYLDLAERSARRLKSPQRVATIMLMRLEYYAIGSNSELFLRYADDIRRYMLEHGDERAANVEALVIKRHTDEGHLQTALSVARRMIERAGKTDDRYMEAYACLSIGNTYAAGEQYAEAAVALEKSLALMRSLGDRVPTIDRIRAGLELIHAAYNTADYSRSLRCCDETLALLEAYMADRSSEEQREVNCRSMHLYLLCCYVRNFVRTGQRDRADDFLRRAEADLYPHIGLDGEFYNETCAIYYRAAGRYAEALHYAERSVEAFAGEELLPYYLDALETQAALKADMGDWQQAYANMKYIERTRDSLDARRFVMQLGELHTLYEVDKIRAQKARQRLILLFTGIACVLLTILVGIYAVYSNRLRSRNRSLYRQIRENMRSEDNAVRALRMTPEEHLSREMKLFRRLTLLMEERHPFTDPDFGRPVLARQLCTNDKYLADAVRKGAGVSVATYISDWRLNYSLRLMALHPEWLIEQIAEYSGYGSYSAFFRAFCRKYSMSPSDYRRLFQQKEPLNE